MKTLHLYLTRQVLATLLMTVAVFTFVLLLGNVLKEILALIINRQATFLGLGQAFALLIPWVLVFALPMGMLTAALLVFGRFSADQELTAVRSSGISLVALVAPILLLSLFLSGISAWINLEIAPRSRVAYKQLLTQMAGKIASLSLPDGRPVTIGKYTIFVGKNDGQTLHQIKVCEIDENDPEQKYKTYTSAPLGKLEIINQQNTLVLYDARTIALRENGTWNPSEEGQVSVPLVFGSGDNSQSKPGLSDMTFMQLRAELKELNQRFAIPRMVGSNTKELQDNLQVLRGEKSDLTMPLLVQMNRQIAFSFACFGFTLVGIPLGIRAHRRETNIGVAIALILVLVYYSFIILGQSLQSHPQLAPHLIVWLPNFIFQSVGAVMLWRANKGI